MFWLKKKIWRHSWRILHVRRWWTQGRTSVPQDDDHEVVCGRPSKEILYNHMHSWFYESRACLLFRTHVLACIQSFGDTLTVTKMKRIKTNIKLYFKGYPNFYYWFTCTYTRKLSRAKETQRKQWVDGTTGARWTYPKCILVLKELTIFTRC